MAERLFEDEPDPVFGHRRRARRADRHSSSRFGLPTCIAIRHCHPSLLSVDVYDILPLAGVDRTQLIVKRPIIGVYIVAACVVLVETQPLAISVLTDRLYIYYWPPSLAGRGERPIGVLLLFLLVGVIYRRLRRHQRAMEGGPLLVPFACFLLCVAWGVVNGLASGGDFRIIVLEVRPFCYLFLAYLLAYNLVTTTRHVRTLLWIIILGAGVKALQGMYIYLGVLHAHLEGHREIMAHEESFFLAAVIVLFVIFSLHHRDRRQHQTIRQLLPLIAIVLIANQRRVAYLELIAGAVVAWILAFRVAPPSGRPRLVTILSVSAPLVLFYVLAFYQDTTFFARPARALVSMFYPDPADTKSAESNLYRTIENRDLLATVKQHPFLGLGFGLPFLQPIALPDISEWNPYYRYIPHNTIYWVWMRLGTIGFLALWYLLGALVVCGGLIAWRLRDRYLQSVAIFVVAVTCMEVLAAYADYQLYALRNVLYLGLLAGVLMKLPSCGADQTPELPGGVFGEVASATQRRAAVA
jgi:hypothetical protein